jgi:7-cyano-7-deazaguanine synthase in queuosine biosynthesis
MTTAFMTLEKDLYLNDVGLLFSGGIDSALLFYLLSKNRHNDNLSLYVIDRYNKPLEHAYYVYNLICQKLNTDKFKLHTLAIPKVANYREIKTAAGIIRSTTNHSMLICGINKYPDDLTIRPMHTTNFRETNYIRYPLKDYYKHDIINQFYKLGIEDILPYTHSCGLDQSSPCAKCFNCRERADAYTILNKDINLGL